MTRSRTAVSALYYAVIGALLLLAITGVLGSVFPERVAKQIGENSEGLLLALGLPAWVQLVRGRLTGSRAQWPVTAAVSAALLLLGLLLISVDDLAGRVETLNEPVFALAVLLPYVQLGRPLPSAAVLALPVAVLLLIGSASTTAFVTDLAECLAMLVLAPIGLDLVDRAVLQPGAPTAALLRRSWYAFLLLGPTAIALAAAPDATGALRYGERLQEAFLGVLVAEVYLATVLVATTSGRHRAPATSPPLQAAMPPEQRLPAGTPVRVVPDHQASVCPATLRTRPPFP